MSVSSLTQLETYRNFFLYDTNHPASLEASVITADRSTSTYLVTCGGASCAPTAFPEQTIIHISGSSWAGERSASGTITSWGCNLGTGTDDVLSDQGGWCSAATVAAEDKLGDMSSSAVDLCFVFERSAVMHITAGLTAVCTDTALGCGETALGTELASIISSANSQALSSLSCPMTTGSASGGSETRTAATSISASQASRTSLSTVSASATGDSQDSGSPRLARGLVLLFGSAVLVAWISLY